MLNLRARVRVHILIIMANPVLVDLDLEAFGEPRVIHADLTRSQDA